MHLYICSGFNGVTIIYEEMNLAKLYYCKLTTFGEPYFKILLHVKFHNLVKRKKTLVPLELD